MWSDSGWISVRLPQRLGSKELAGDAGMQEMWVRSLGWQAPLEEEMAAHSSILTRKTSQSMRSQRVG